MRTFIDIAQQIKRFLNKYDYTKKATREEVRKGIAYYEAFGELYVPSHSNRELKKYRV